MRKKNFLNKNRKHRILSLTILKIYRHTPVFIAAFMRNAALSNAKVKIVINGFAMEKDRMTMGPIFSGTW